MKSLKKPQKFTGDLGVAALDFTTSMPAKPFKLEQVYIKFSQAVSETVTITVDSVDDAAYDEVLQEVVLVAERDFTYRPQGQCNWESGDQIKVECTDNGGVGTLKGKVKTSEVAY